MTAASDNFIYMRPQKAGTPVDYIKSMEKAGLISFPKEYLGIYVCRGVGPAGPQGVAGTDQNSLFDTIIASASDEDSAITVDAVTPKTTFRAPYALDLSSGYVRASLTSAPTGAKFEIDVHMNGTTIFTTKITIDINEKTSVTAAIPAVLSVTDIPDDAEFEIFVTQIGSTISGMGLKVAVTGIKVE